MNGSGSRRQAPRCSYRSAFDPLSAAVHGWRLAAVVALAMRDAAEDVAGLKDGTLWLKWPNDIVADAHDGGIRKLAGVLGESVASGDRVESAVVGIGVNTRVENDRLSMGHRRDDEQPARALGQAPDRQPGALAGLSRSSRAALRGVVEREFRHGGWSSAQRTTGRTVVVDAGDNSVTGKGFGVDPESGALLVQPDFGSVVAVDSGEVIRCRVI